jgi:hypothetical protein
MCLRGRTGAHLRAQDIRRQVGAPSVQFSPVILCNFAPVLTHRSARGGSCGQLRRSNERSRCLMNLGVGRVGLKPDLAMPRPDKRAPANFY